MNDQLFYDVINELKEVNKKLDKLIGSKGPTKEKAIQPEYETPEKPVAAPITTGRRKAK